MTPRDTFDLDELLSPADAFGHPSEVVHDPDLSLNEKRAILASWASDASAVEAAPHLRPAARGMASFDEVMDALRELDREVARRGWDYRARKATRIKTILEGSPDDQNRDGGLQA